MHLNDYFFYYSAGTIFGELGILKSNNSKRAIQVVEDRVSFAAGTSKPAATAALRPRQVANAPAKTGTPKSGPKSAGKAGAEFPPLPTPRLLAGPSTSAPSNDSWQLLGGGKLKKSPDDKATNGGYNSGRQIYEMLQMPGRGTHPH